MENEENRAKKLRNPYPHLRGALSEFPMWQTPLTANHAHTCNHTRPDYALGVPAYTN